METPHTQNATSEGNTIAVIAWLTIIGLIVALVMNSGKKNPIASYHIKQSLGLSLTALVLGVIGMVPVLGWIINIFGMITLLILWIFGLISAINGEQKPVPLLGEKFEEWFKNITV